MRILLAVLGCLNGVVPRGLWRHRTCIVVEFLESKGGFPLYLSIPSYRSWRRIGRRIFAAFGIFRIPRFNGGVSS